VSAFSALAALFLALLLLTGCGGHKRTSARVPVAPPAPDFQLSIPANAKAIYVETGIASWYGPPYHNRRAANGEIFDMHQPTAAHRTLPLNSIVRVTNLSGGRSIVVRITDRGPFIAGRVLDLSEAAAQQIDIWRSGTGRVRIEVLQAPVPIATGGRWAVQVGAFENASVAGHLRQKLAHDYRDARILQFSGPTGEWIRIRIPEDNRQRAELIARQTRPAQGAAFLVRLD